MQMSVGLSITTHADWLSLTHVLATMQLWFIVWGTLKDNKYSLLN